MSCALYTPYVLPPIHPYVLRPSPSHPTPGPHPPYLPTPPTCPLPPRNPPGCSSLYLADLTPPTRIPPRCSSLYLAGLELRAFRGWLQYLQRRVRNREQTGRGRRRQVQLALARWCCVVARTRHIRAQVCLLLAPSSPHHHPPPRLFLAPLTPPLPPLTPTLTHQLTPLPLPNSPYQWGRGTLLGLGA